MPGNSHASPSPSEFEALQTVISTLEGFEAETRQRILGAGAIFLGVTLVPDTRHGSASLAGPSEARDRGPVYPPFSADTSISPKEFLYEKQPGSDVERIAVLAFYLAQFRETPQFKTLDLSKLNTEAAQPKFSNAANSANNAVKQGYLVPTTKGHRQLSAAGERFVNELPDRDAARAAMSAAVPRKRVRRAAAKRA